jgi:hypothetical protein
MMIKVDNSLVDKMADFIGNEFIYSDVWVRETQRTFNGNRHQNQYDLELITGCDRVIGTVVDGEIVPADDAFPRTDADTGTPVRGPEQELENFDVLFKRVKSGQSKMQKKVLKAHLAQNARESGLNYEPDAEPQKSRFKRPFSK